MSGYDDLPQWKRNKINKFAQKREGMEEGSNEWNRMTNKINRWSGQGGWAWSDNFRKPFGNQNTPFQKSMDASTGGFDASQFDVNNKADVIAIQKQLFPDNPEEWDGMFGPKTESAFRQANNQNRLDSGQEAYQYANSSGTGGGDQGSESTSSLYSPGGYGVSNMSGSGSGSGDVDVPGNNQHVMNSGNVIEGNTSKPNWMDFGSGILNKLYGFFD